jgi:tetratricopeptide (TPR) repeat protein
MRYSLTFLVVIFAACGWAFSATAQVVPNRDSAAYYFRRGASFYGVPGANKAVVDSGRRRAIADYSKSIAFDSSYCWAYRNRGYCHQNAGEYELALADYERAIRIGRRPGNENLDYLHSRCTVMCMYYHSAWRYRAEIRVKLQKYTTARQDYSIYQQQTAAELLTEEKNLLEIQQHAISQRDLKQLPKRDRAKALAHYKEYLAEQEVTVDKLRTESAATAAKIAELAHLLR